MEVCPCGSEKLYAACCERYISGKEKAPTSEALMRARYTAYTKANIDYIADTMKGKPLQGFSKKSVQVWAQSVQWLGLQIVQVTDMEKDHGYVEFIARYRYQDREETLHEASEFRCKNGCWYYVDGSSL